MILGFVLLLCSLTMAAASPSDDDDFSSSSSSSNNNKGAKNIIISKGLYDCCSGSTQESQAQRQPPLEKEGLVVKGGGGGLHKYATKIKAITKKTISAEKIVLLLQIEPIQTIVPIFEETVLAGNDDDFFIPSLAASEKVLIDLLSLSSADVFKKVALIAIKTDLHRLMMSIIRIIGDDFDFDYPIPDGAFQNYDSENSDGSESDSDSDSFRNKKTTLLMLAMRKWSQRPSNREEYSEILLSLINKTYKLDFRDSYGHYTALIYGSMSGSISLVRALVDRAIFLEQLPLIIDQVDLPVRESSLHKAFKLGFDDIGKFLLLNGADSTLQSRYGETALQLSKGSNNRKCITQLPGK